jgi:uncharacterized protein (TIGR00645 family)
MSKGVEHVLEVVMFGSRWLLAPMYLGLVLGLTFLLVKFGQETWHLASHIMDLGERDVILGILALVDLTLVANLMIMVIFAGYENFVSKIDVANHEDRPDWMGKVDYSGLKLKLIGSIVAISAIDILRAFMNIEKMTDNALHWMIIIHVVFILSGVLFALMDYISAKAEAVGHH